jgi:hypothetical protein
MARRRTPVEAWMRTPDKVDFYPPMYFVRHICTYAFYEKRESESVSFF